LLVNGVLSGLKHGGRFGYICVTQQGRELRKRTLPPDPGPILSAPPIYARVSAEALGKWQAERDPAARRNGSR
jgi:hypothetical protein